MTTESLSSSIKSWPATERPRERLFERGASSLSDAELLSILFRGGVRGKDAVTLSREILSHFQNLRGLLCAERAELHRIKGLGAAKAASLLAAAEIARRALRQEIPVRDIVRDPESVVQYLIASLRDRKREVFKVLFLDKANSILAEEDLFEGTVDQAAVHPREIVKAALARHATAVILVHNHPSGRVQPSPEDRDITRRIADACRTVSIKVLDHIIVGDNQTFSFAEHGLM